MNRLKSLSTILKQIGNLLVLLSFVVVIPAFVSLLYREWYSAIGFTISAVFIVTVGVLLTIIFKKADDVQYTNALVVVAASWLGFVLFGGIPFWVVAHITPIDVMNGFIPHGANYTVSSLFYFRNSLHCLFESMSAFTTTGLSMAVHEPSVGKGILFYRSIASWAGGAGFVVLSLAIFKHTSGKGAMLLYGSESTGEKLTSRVIETARSIWKSYLAITLLAFLYLVIGTRIILPDYPFLDNIFDSINHAMAGICTGGFSTLDDHMATYNSPQMEMLYLLPMILGTFSLPFYYKVLFMGKINQVWKDIQTRSLIALFAVGSVIQVYLLTMASSVSNPVREGIFQFVSALSTTGWQTANIMHWDWLSIVYICAVAMFIGGASGATVGGIKMIRALIIKKGLQWQVSKVFLTRHTVKTIHFNGRTILPDEMNEEFTKSAAMAILFFLLIIGSSIATMIITNGQYRFVDVLFEASSAQGTVGLSSGITCPEMSPVVEGIYIFQMWTGRLEIIAVFALIRAIIWGTNPSSVK